MTPSTVLRGLAKFLAVALAAGAVGALLGVGLAALSGDDDDGGAAVVPQTTSTSSNGSATTPARPTSTAATSTTPATDVSRTTRVQVVSAVLYPAATPSGQARRRARLVVRLRLTSRSKSPIPARAPMLIVGNTAIRSDRRADERAGELLRPLAPAKSATGELFFETAGDVTELLTSRGRASLSIAQRTVDVPIRVSTAPAPQG